MRPLLLVFVLSLAACSAAPRTSPLAATVPEPWRREVTLFEASELLPRGAAEGPARLLLDGRLVWEGTIVRSRVKPDAFEAVLTTPLTEGSAPEVTIAVGPRTFTAQAPRLEAGKFLLLYCGADGVRAFVDASRARE